ncbi:MAG: rhodanese-related sulfurtransferase [Candidatus Caenarcaniphilales bacterium]|nr:rhodanese-related sulfurtransferase [Candidatus Caenarcaniphilales bacterium]
MSEKIFLVATFYKFTTLDDYEQLAPKLKDFMLTYDIKGTILLASEGINSTVSGSKEAIYALLGLLRKDSRLADMPHKEAFYNKQVFKRSKVKLKKEIVTLGQNAAGRKIDPKSKVGKYVKPQDWNTLLEDPDVLVIDTRNNFEVKMGSFKNAINPHTKKFKEIANFTEDILKPAVLKNKASKKIAMFCTGGIRCEKYSSYLLENFEKEGFDEIYHLEGGILKYLEEVPQEESLWKGDCFVFDEREKVNHRDYQY